MSTGVPTTARDPESFAPGMWVTPHFRLERLIGQGGFGSVFAAIDTRDGRRVAIKVLSRRVLQMSGGEARFRREAELARRLSHDNSVRVYEAGEDASGTLYIVFEYLEGRSVEAEIVAHGPIVPPRALAIAIEVLKALEEAHAACVIHRDIKPANIFLLGGEREGRVKVLDFGIAKSINQGTFAGLTREGMTLGTPAYMAPEQLTGGNVEPSTDLFALGVVLAEMLLGRPLFETSVSVMEIIRSRLLGSPVPIPESLANSAFGQIILRATAREPSSRFTSAGQMRASLEALVPFVGDALPTQIGSMAFDTRPTSTAFGPTGQAMFSPSGATPRSDGSASLGPMNLGRVNQAPLPLFSPIPAGPSEARFPSATFGTTEAPSRAPIFALLAIGAFAFVAGLSVLGFALYQRSSSSEARTFDETESDESSADEKPKKKKRSEPPDDPGGAISSRVAPQPPQPQAPLPPAPLPPPPKKTKARLKVCNTLTASNEPQIKREVSALGWSVTGVIHYCPGDMVNFQCVGPTGRGLSCKHGANEGGVTAIRFASSATASAFANTLTEGSVAVAGTNVLIIDMPDAEADALLARVCK